MGTDDYPKGGTASHRPLPILRVTEGSKSGEAGFNLGILKAEVNLKNIKALLDWLGDRIYGSNLTLEYGEVRLEYRTTQQLEQQLQALERIDKLKVRVIKGEPE